MTSCHAVLIPILLLVMASIVHAKEPIPQEIADATQSSITQKVDELFAVWNKSDTPGCALAVIKDGKIIYSHGYGMADLEREAPNAPSTIFHIASMSKQFRDCSKDTGFIQPVHNGVRRGFGDGLGLGLHATYPVPSGH
jgi:hypothetical protein